MLLWSGMVCTQTYQFFLPHVNCAVTLSQKINNMGIISNMTNLTNKVRWQYSWNVVGNALTDLMLKSFQIITEKNDETSLTFHRVSARNTFN